MTRFFQGGLPRGIGGEIPLPLSSSSDLSSASQEPVEEILETIFSPHSSFNKILTPEDRSDSDFTPHSKNTICTELEYMARGPGAL